MANEHDRSVPGVQQNGLLSCRSRAGFLVTLSPGGSGHVVSGAPLEETRSGVLCEGWLQGGLAPGSCGGKGSAWDGLTLPAAARGGRPAACHAALTPPGGDTGTVGATTATSVPGARVKSTSTGQVGTRGLLG